MSEKKSKAGTLFLIPMPIGREAPDVLASASLEQLYRLKYFFSERGKTARAFLKALDYPHSLQRETKWWEIKSEADPWEIKEMIDVLENGHDVGLLSEAGAPGIADPGGKLVLAAHRHHIDVRPLIGPSSISMALMAFGMNGQQFTFHGYLSRRDTARDKAIKRLENESRRTSYTQLFMEAPYRNMKLFNALVDVLHPETFLGVAADITDETEWIRTFPVKHWSREVVDLHKRPAIFGIWVRR